MTSRKFKLVLLAGASSVHTVRWANGLSNAGHEVHVISQHAPCDPLDDGIILHKLPFRGTLGYFTMVPAVKRLLKHIQPDIVNAHYASGYATTAAMVGFRPWLLSVWGSDIYDFPTKSILHKWLVQANLHNADKIASTSYAMATETYKYVKKNKCNSDSVAITPFGVDIEDYESIPELKDEYADEITIGTIKGLDSKYGIDILLRAFSGLVKRLKIVNDCFVPTVKLRIVGDGPQSSELKQMANKLGIGQSVEFVGRVSHSEVPSQLALIDIFIALSRRESFGVSVLEAGAAGRPVIVSDSGGLPEVVENDHTGIIVGTEDTEAATNAMERLVLNPSLRKKMGVQGRAHVHKHYAWLQSIKDMEEVYQNTIDSAKA
ncbi:glycosyltransferase [Salinivibrio sp. ES.052]|uniref:glycosyltransferase n=1 Tax=Salinivibrio sp. ES.052 TaxID=1882823 RepID=UPI00092A212A|nr:glycosyltransferase [Salinivibrio sp. ES.052]SIN79274.1 Glycosyltransferase involved in cell wall bisynthesis [Salinivibrio sp. ES.052]